MSSQKVIYMTDDTCLTIPTVRMACTCDWTEKAFRRDAITRAEKHLRFAHNGGLLKYKGETRKV